MIGSIDARQEDDRWVVHSEGGRRRWSRSACEWAQELEHRGAGEILINNIDRDGLRGGYNLQLVDEISSAVGVPVIAAGGANTEADLRRAVEHGASAAAAGSMFVFWGEQQAVLVNYPDLDRRRALFSSEWDGSATEQGGR